MKLVHNELKNYEKIWLCFMVGLLHFPEEVRNQQKLSQDTMPPG
jgi:hypothetical protein